MLEEEGIFLLFGDGDRTCPPPPPAGVDDTLGDEAGVVVAEE